MSGDDEDGVTGDAEGGGDDEREKTGFVAVGEDGADGVDEGAPDVDLVGITEHVRIFGFLEERNDLLHIAIRTRNNKILRLDRRIVESILEDDGEECPEAWADGISKELSQNETPSNKSIP
jgi:hypothetical protein